SAITQVVVSSEDDEILEFSRRCGADGIRRPPEYSCDDSSSESVILHCLEFLAQTENYRPAVFILLQPTSPLRTAGDIDDAFQLFSGNQCTALISGCEPEKNPLKSFILGQKGYLEGIRDDVLPFLPRQELPRAFSPNGAIYIIETERFLENRRLLTKETVPFFMESERSLDIDTLSDLETAEGLKPADV
ncbi:MAG: acylneuraminate cytidylyltransferase family protein, partial [bacterium]|nr:acylneuraminate cytidylyltransferase family protein [bacterium]